MSWLAPSPEGRAKKIAALVAMLARGETIHPNGATRPRARGGDTVSRTRRQHHWGFGDPRGALAIGYTRKSVESRAGRTLILPMCLVAW